MIIQHKYFYVNTGITQLTTSTGNSTEWPQFVYKSQPLLCWYVQDENGVALDLTGYTFTFAINSTYNGTHLIRSTAFNSDWEKEDITMGQISCILDMDNASILNYLGTTYQKTGQAALWASKDNVNYLLAQFTCNLNNSVTSITHD